MSHDLQGNVTADQVPFMYGDHSWEYGFKNAYPEGETQSAEKIVYSRGYSLFVLLRQTHNEIIVRRQEESIRQTQPRDKNNDRK